MAARLRSSLSYANVMATIAVFLALGGGAFAALRLPKASVGSRELKARAVTPSKVAPATIALFRGQAGIPGPTGPAGAAGTPGVQGAPGIQGIPGTAATSAPSTIHTSAGANVSFGTTPTVLTGVNPADGPYLLTGGVVFHNSSGSMRTVTCTGGGRGGLDPFTVKVADGADVPWMFTGDGPETVGPVFTVVMCSTDANTVTATAVRLTALELGSVIVP